jgi:hypothetical protein
LFVSTKNGRISAVIPFQGLAPFFCTIPQMLSTSKKCISDLAIRILRQRNISSFSDKMADDKKLIRQNTVIHRCQMVPEIQLHLLTPASELWRTPYENGKPFTTDPFW